MRAAQICAFGHFGQFGGRTRTMLRNIGCGYFDGCCKSGSQTANKAQHQTCGCATCMRSERGASSAQGLPEPGVYKRQTQKEICEKCGVTAGYGSSSDEASGGFSDESMTPETTMSRDRMSRTSFPGERGTGASCGSGRVTQLHAAASVEAAPLTAGCLSFSMGWLCLSLCSPTGPSSRTIPVNGSACSIVTSAARCPLPSWP